jgi:hypothetical protein
MSQSVQLQEAIRQLHGCELQFRLSTIVREPQGSSAWTGIVDLFDLIGHRSAQRCFAWSHPLGPETMRLVAVLKEAPLDTAE